LKLSEAKKAEKALNESFQDLSSKLASAEALLKSAIFKITAFNEQILEVKVKIEEKKQALKLEKIGGNTEVIDAQINAIEAQQNALNGIENKAEKLKDLQSLYRQCSATKLLQNEYNLLIIKIKELYNGASFEKECNDIQTGFVKTQANIQSSTKIIKDLKDEFLPKQKTFETEQVNLENQVKLVGFEDLKTNSVISTIQRENVWHPFYEINVEEMDFKEKLISAAEEKKLKSLGGAEIIELQKQLNLHE
jgi:hypothetical protein